VRPLDGTRECGSMLPWLRGQSSSLANLARWRDRPAFKFLLLHFLHELKMRRQLRVRRMLLRRNGWMLLGNMFVFCTLVVFIFERRMH
jgi:hypothetical protein